MRLKYVLVKELRQLRRNPTLLRMAILLPIMQTLLLSCAANMDVVAVPVVVWDADGSADSRRLVEALRARSEFRLVGYRLDPDQLQADLDSGVASLALTIPRGYARDLERGRAKVQLLIDGSESTTSTVAAAYVGQIVADLGSHAQRWLADRRGARAPLGRVRAESRVLYNPDLRTLWFMAPGIMGLVLVTLMQNLTALSIARERELGTLEQVVMTPVTAAELLLGKLVPFGVIGLVDAGVVSLVVVHGLGVPFRGSVLLLGAAALAFLFAVLGLGLLVSAVSANQQQAQITNFFLAFPSMLLSGFIFPAWNLPPVLRQVSTCVPLTHFLAVVRGVFLRGADAHALWPNLAWLLGLSVLFFGLGVRLFRKRLE